MHTDFPDKSSFKKPGELKKYTNKVRSYDPSVVEDAIAIPIMTTHGRLSTQNIIIGIGNDLKVSINLLSLYNILFNMHHLNLTYVCTMLLYYTFFLPIFQILISA